MLNREKVVARFGVVLLFIISAFISVSTHAESDDSVIVDHVSIDNQIRDLEKRAVENRNLYEGLTDTLHDVHELNDKMDVCVKKSQSRLREVNLLEQKLHVLQEHHQHEPVYAQDIRQEKISLLSQISWCYLASFRLNGIDDQITKNFNTVQKSRLLIRSHSIWQAWHSGVNVPGLKEMARPGGIEQINLINGAGFVLMILIGLLAGWLVQRQHVPKDHYFVAALVRHVHGLLPVLVAVLYINIMLQHITPVPVLVLVANSILCYALLFFVINVLSESGVKKELYSRALTAFLVILSLMIFIYIVGLANFYDKNNFHLHWVEYRWISSVLVVIRLLAGLLNRERLRVDSPAFLQFKKSLSFLFVIAAAGYIVWAALSVQYALTRLSVLSSMLFLLLWNLAWVLVIGFLLKCYRNTYIGLNRKFWMVQPALVVSWVLLTISAAAGYRYLSLMLIPNVIITMVLIEIIIDINRMLYKAYGYASDPDSSFSRKLRNILGIDTRNRLTELYVLRVTLGIVPVVLGMFCILEFWGLTRYQVGNFFAHLHEGYSVLGVTVYPVRVLRAANIFCIFILASRAITTWLSRRFFYREEEHTQVILVSMMHYVLFSSALILAFFVAGFNLRGLVVVIGALSVGIGFGLQSFARDFISGLIIMFSKPVKIGDHVMINDNKLDYDGYIKKIGALSTQIQTLQHTDVFVPNSSIISKTITNYTFSANRLYRIKINVIVENASDLHAGKQILMNVAQGNSRVVQDSPNQPGVFFEADELNLVCIVNDVNARDAIVSELSLAITEAFREHGIAMKLGKSTSS